MEIRIYVDLFVSLLDYPTLKLVDKTADCVKALEKESPKTAERLGDFLDYLFDTPMRELELSFTRSPQIRRISRLHQCYERYHKGMINSKNGGIARIQENKIAADFRGFINSISEISSENDLNYVICNFIHPSIQIIIQQLNNSILKAGSNPHLDVSHEYLLKFRNAFIAIYKVITRDINSEEISAMFSIDPSRLNEDPFVETSVAYMYVS